MRAKAKIGAITVLLATAALPAQATFHLMKVVEVFPGTAAAPNAQYVVIQMYADGQNHVAGHAITVFNAAGTLVSTFTFGGDVLDGLNQDKILIATTEAQNFFGVTPDLIMTAALLSAGGKVCWADTIDCVAWGAYTGSSFGVGTPFNASGGLVSGKAAIRRFDIAGSSTALDGADDTDNSINDFLAGTPAPRNNFGVAGTIPPATCGNGTIEGLEECDDHNVNNGDTCSSTCKTTEITTLSIADVSTTEGNSGTKLVTFPITLSQPATTTVTYNIATADLVNAGAKAGGDYVAHILAGQTIAIGQSSGSFVVTIIGDTSAEPDERFAVNISNVVNAAVVNGFASGTIVNDDGAQLSIADISLTEGDSGTKLATFTVSLSAPAPTGGVTFNITTADTVANGVAKAPASAGSDYVARSLTGQTIAAGQTSKTFDVTINGDTTVESNETFSVIVSNVVNAAVADSLAFATIVNDDP